MGPRLLLIGRVPTHGDEGGDSALRTLSPKSRPPKMGAATKPGWISRRPGFACPGTLCATTYWLRTSNPYPHPTGPRSPFRHLGEVTARRGDGGPDTLGRAEGEGASAMFNRF